MTHAKEKGTPAKTSLTFMLFTFALVAAFALSGCGGGGGSAAVMPTPDPMPGGGQQMPGSGTGGTGGDTGGGETPMQPPTPMPYVVDGLVANPGPSVFANSAADTRESVLAQGEMLAPLTVGIDRNFNTGPDRGVDAPKDGMTYLKSISGDGAGGYHVNYVLGGEETPIHLTAADLDPGSDTTYRKQMADGSEYLFWQYSSFFSGLFTYFDARGWRYGPGSTELDRRGVTVYGARTVPENLPAMGSAIYEGRMYADIWNADNPSFGSSRTNFNSRLTLKANFDDGEISGWINRFNVRNSRNDGNMTRSLGRGNLITISGGEIDDGRFTADWTGSDSVMDRAPENSMSGFSGKMLGEFFGPAAEEVGGVLNGNRAATATTPEQLLIGFFGAIGRQPVVRDSTEAFEPDFSASVEQEFSGADIGVRTPDQGEAYVKSIAKDGAGGVRVAYVINGVESVIDLSAADVSGASGTLNRIIGDKDYTLWRYTNIANRLNYAEITGWARDINDSAGDAIKRYRGVNVHGIATENMPTTGSATYEGRVYADAWDVNDPSDGTGRTRILGALTLEANFGSSEVSGRIDELERREPGESSYQPLGSGSSISISNGMIGRSGFSADWTEVDTDPNNAGEPLFSGTMNGGFYGPAAAEVAGEFNGSRPATATDSEQIMVGVFGGSKME